MEGLCPWLRKHLPDTKILYYFPPGSWRRTLKSTPLAGLVDKVATPFPWSEAELRRLGVDATFVGHPLLDLVHPLQSPVAFAERYGIDRERPVVGILPGSRSQEIADILPVQLAAASIIHQRVPGVQFLIGLAPTVDRDEVTAQIEREHRRREEVARSEQEAREQRARREETTGLGPTVPVPAEGGGAVGSAGDLVRQREEWLRRAAEMPPAASGDFPVAIVEDATYDMMTAADVLLITSGTATLEAAILGKPMVIVYKMAQANRIEYHFVKGRLPRYIGMPNILAGRSICPEFIQDAATPEALAQEVIGLLLEPDRILRMREDLRAVVTQLGEPGGAARTARMVVELAESAKAARGERPGGGSST
jgi:lipid-A-disaccharide synthase